MLNAKRRDEEYDPPTIELRGIMRLPALRIADMSGDAVFSSPLSLNQVFTVVRLKSCKLHSASDMQRQGWFWPPKASAVQYFLFAFRYGQMDCNKCLTKSTDIFGGVKWS